MELVTRNDIRNIDFYEDRSDRCKEDRSDREVNNRRNNRRCNCERE